MRHWVNSWGTFKYVCGLLGCIAAWPVQATVVQFQTTLGDIEVNLYDDTTPDTVTNFLMYVEAGAYENTVIHRSAKSFVIQGGGYTLNDDSLDALLTPWSPDNEPVYSNIRGTIAMAKLEDDPNSATSQWFVNLGNNASNLDHANGGFTVFGQVIGDGMAVVDAIAALERFNLGGAFTSAPLLSRPDSQADFLANMDEFLVVVENIVVLDAAPDSAANLDRPLRSDPPPKPAKAKKKGGAMEWYFLMLLGALMLVSKTTAGVRSIHFKRQA